MRIIKRVDGWCAVLALQNVTGFAQDTVVEVCESNGFHPFDGMEDQEWQSAAKELGVKLKTMRIVPQKLRRFLRTHKTGLFLVGSKDHLLVVRDGRFFDPIWGSLDIIIKQSWRVL